ncbi:SH3 domain-containing protein [Bosea vestrisii]|uniref:SH3 domain-containing protein n=1 Tax=Bosea vestrisii TaxID=151416 RepID=UPI003D769258
MGRKLGGWLVIGACVFALAKCGETKSPAPVSQAARQTPTAVTHELPVRPAATTPSTPPPASARSLFSEPLTDRFVPKTEATQRPIKRSLYVAGKEVPLRAAPDGKAKILDRLPTGMEVGELARREGWVEVRHPVSAVEGWMSTRRLTTKRPSPGDEVEEKPTPKPPPKIDVLTDAAIIARLIALDVASYSGNCRCPENTDRAGRRCGARSAHSRAGGRAPLCYPSDVSPGAIAAFRANGSR